MSHNNNKAFKSLRELSNLLYTMFSPHKTVFLVQLFFETKSVTKSVTKTRRLIHTKMKKKPPSANVIKDWVKRFKEMESVHDLA